MENSDRLRTPLIVVTEVLSPEEISARTSVKIKFSFCLYFHTKNQVDFSWIKTKPIVFFKTENHPHTYYYLQAIQLRRKSNQW
jgi:predicted small secreted protein